MHVWADDATRYPFSHPYNHRFGADDVPHPATVEMLLEDMDRHGVTHAILVQVIYHGWDNSYVADCVTRHPDRFRAHGLIDPTDPRVADKLEYWVRERGLSGMRLSPIYYRGGARGGDAWLTSSAHEALWERAEELDTVFNFFIATEQLPRLEEMIRRHPGVVVCVDHLAQIDLSVDDPQPALDRLLALSDYPRVWVKVSELTSVSGSDYPFRKSYPWLKQVHDAFGSERLLWGTGYPGAARAAYSRPTLGEELALIRQEIPFFSAEDCALILGRNAARIWKLEG